MPRMNNNNFNSTSTRPPSGNGSPGSYTSPLSSPIGTRPPSLMDHQQSLPNVVRVTVIRDGGGYGMKVSGDNPVFVQSVKDGGPAEKAGLHAGDKIIQVNGSNVMHSTHTDVVALIKAHAQVVLTVQQRTSPLRSPGSRPSSLPSSTKITAPQPVDNEKQYQLQQEKEQYYRLMIEKEQHHLDKLRSEVATSPNEKKCLELAKAEKNLRILQDNLSRSVEQHTPDSYPIRSLSSPNNFGLAIRRNNSDEPPPLPKRSKQSDVNMMFLSNEINANSSKTAGKENMPGDVPPPLPPRTYPPHNTHTDDASAANSIDKQMSYPLVATCTSLHSDYLSNSSKHQRTKSSPDCLISCTDGNMDGSQRHSATPPGTPPPPYPSPEPGRRYQMMGESYDGSFDFSTNSPNEIFSEVDQHNMSHNSHIRAANSRVAQQTIISMEDDDISDLEIDQVEDHGYFKSLSRLWEHLPHLAVFMNYVLSNSDPNSLLFYLLTDLYKEGNAKEMRKWAFEIHSCFLVPGAPLRLNNVDENIAREIDDDLTKEYEKEEIMRKTFWKARQRAKEELTRQLADFQQKRTAGLGTIYGPTDQELMDHYNDKIKEAKLYESLFVPKVELYLEEMEKETYDPQKYYLAAALITILTRVFRVRPQNLDLDRLPTFVNKERSFKAKLIGKYSRKLSHLSHQFVAQQYFTVMPCNYCHQIIYGISPQGYQCSACLINLHRSCVKLYDDSCPGPFRGKERGIRKLIGMRHDLSEQNRLRKASQFIQIEKEKRQIEEKDCIIEASETDFEEGSSKSFTQILSKDSSADNFATSSTSSIVPVSQKSNLDSFLVRTSAAKKKNFDTQVARFIYATNCAFRTVDHPEFKKLLEILHPGYQPPNRHQIGNELLCKVYETIHNETKKELAGKTVCMSIDRWSNIRNDSIVCESVIDIQEGNVYLIDTIDTENKSHTSDYLLSLLIESIKRCLAYNCTVRTVVTDNAANMTKMRAELAKSEELGLLDILTYGCSAHIMNLLAHDIQVPLVKEHIKKIIKYFGNVHFAAGKYKLSGGKALVLPQDVRWNTLAGCIESYLENWHILCKICSENRVALDTDIVAKVQDMNLKMNAQDYLVKLKKIAIALDQVQKDNCTISECTEIWIELSVFFNENENCTDFDREKFNRRYEMAMTPTHYLANLLDHRFRGSKLTQTQREIALEHASTYYSDTMPLIISYQAEASPFKRYLFAESLKRVKPIIWWNALNENLNESTRSLVKQLHSAIAPSAGLEPLFS